MPTRAETALYADFAQSLIAIARRPIRRPFVSIENTVML